MKEENKQLKQMVEKLTKDIGQYQIGTPLCPAELTMTNFEQHKKDGDTWHSPPFYTHPKGYKMCFEADVAGHGDGANTHVSVFFKLMKGEYDDQLKWPFQGTFTIQLLSQNGEERHCERVLSYDSDDPDECTSRAVDGEVTKTGLGFHKFIPHSDLKPIYLQNDCLKFRITY
jgi:TNF receptor-associated factor 4